VKAVAFRVCKNTNALIHRARDDGVGRTEIDAYADAGHGVLDLSF
jgi:hypothetical protein